MFPLGAVLFPRALLSLHVFEPRYRIMVRDLLAGDHEFGVVLIERGSEVGGGDVRAMVGTLARVVRAEPFPDGRYALDAVGLRRLRVERWLVDDPYPVAEVVELSEDTAGSGAEVARARLEGLVRRMLEVWAQVEPARARPGPEFASDDEPGLDREPGAAAYRAAALAECGPFDAQRVLAADDVVERLAIVEALVAARIEVLEARPRDW